MAYWGRSLPSRLYSRLIMAAAAILWVAIFTGALHLPYAVQLVLCGGVALFVLFFRVIVPNGFSNITNEFMAASDQARAELADGNFDGVPDFLQESFPYPTRNDNQTDEAQEDEEEQCKSEE